MKTVRVRIAVAVNPGGEGDGSWAAFGWSKYDESSSAMLARNWLENSHAPIVFIEADVPLPEPVEAPTVEGKVQP